MSILDQIMKEAKGLTPEKQRRLLQLVKGMGKREENDLQEIVLSEVRLDSRRVLRLKKPLVLAPMLNDSSDLLVLEYAPLDIRVFATNRDQLSEELVEQVRMLWIEYAEAEPAELTAPAAELRQALLRGAEVVTNGAS